MDKKINMITNILKYTVALFTLLIAATSCTEDIIEPWQLSDYIHFQNGAMPYSFIYAGSHVQKDTVVFKLNIAGKVYDKDRTFNVKQVKSYGYIYEKDNLGHIIDSAFIELPNQAVVGIHYEPLDNENFIVPANSLTGDVKVVLLRDPSLKTNNYTLTLKVIENENFKPGNAAGQKSTLTISDQISQPKTWNSYLIGNSTVFSVMGYYGKVKHQLIIDATKQRWDDIFIQKELSEEYLVFYKNLAVLELNRINDERALQGLPKLREDDNNPNSEVYFF